MELIGEPITSVSVIANYDESRRPSKIDLALQMPDWFGKFQEVVAGHEFSLAIVDAYNKSYLPIFLVLKVQFKTGTTK